MARNIKDKGNRKNVISLLTRISGKLRVYKMGCNGLLIFCGIDIHSDTIEHLVEPPNPIKEFYYTCAKHFEVDRFCELFMEQSLGHVVLLDGNVCYIYRYTGTWNKLKTITANLIKRHHKGGQSSVRFSRLAEESRHNYVVHVMDWIHKLVTGNNNYIFGSREIKDMLLSLNELKVPLETCDSYHVFTENTINDSYFVHIMQDKRDAHAKQIEQVIEYIARDSDWLLFSRDEIMAQKENVEYVVVMDKNITLDVPTILVSHDSPYYGKLHHYSVIGKLYYKT